MSHKRSEPDTKPRLSIPLTRRAVGRPGAFGEWRRKRVVARSGRAGIGVAV